MDDQNVLTFYKLCCLGDMHGLINIFENLSDTSSIEMSYAYYIVWVQSNLNDNRLEILKWLFKLDSDIDVDRIENEYLVDEHIPNDALVLACKKGHCEVIKWLFTKEHYLSSFQNRCNIVYIFEISCCFKNLDIVKIIFQKLSDYISERSNILNQAYNNAINNQNTQVIKWLLEIDKNNLLNY